MNIRNAFTVLALGALSACLLANAQAGPRPPGKKNGSATAGDGEQRFKTNCGRCHNPPESLRPSEVRAVARHMRVRAMLTAEDEKLILEYLAP